MGLFKLKSEYFLSGDQKEAVSELLDGLKNNCRFQTLQGVTGSGKTFTLANVISKVDKPVLIISHNKTLAAQLYSEFKAFFPDNAVEYFISYYDYYLPESYIPQTDTYIAKDASINENIEKLRLSASSSLTERRDCIIIASVSSIYGLGSPEDYANMCINLSVNQEFSRDELLMKLVNIQYSRNDTVPSMGDFRVRGDSVDIFEPQREEFIRVSFWGDEIESIERYNNISGKLKNRAEKVTIFPCKHFVLPQERILEAESAIRAELKERVQFFEEQGLAVEAQRLYQRVTYDLEMMKEIGYCSGIENYSMHLARRQVGSRPYTLFDFFGDDFLMLIDESHVTLPQLNAMYKADRCRKTTLIEHGFRLPSALENRPMKFEEIEKFMQNTIFVSATPGDYELNCSEKIVQQVIRPTGLLDPLIEVRPLATQVDDCIDEIRKAAAKKERVIVTTLTKKGAEKLSDYLSELAINVSCLHSEMDAIERVKVLSKLKNGEFDCVIGINLLREGIDLPEVALVAILDADKEGFLRSDRALIQVAGRAARNANGRVILYGDVITPAMDKLIKISNEHRKIQMKYNEEHNIIPKTIVKKERLTISEIVALSNPDSQKNTNKKVQKLFAKELNPLLQNAASSLNEEDIDDIIRELESEMYEAAEKLEFERAADLRDQIKKIRKTTV